jgi:hypothetical protein
MIDCGLQIADFGLIKQRAEVGNGLKAEGGRRKERTED